MDYLASLTFKVNTYFKLIVVVAIIKDLSISFLCTKKGEIQL
jgi:hypothetical protein